MTVLFHCIDGLYMYIFFKLPIDGHKLFHVFVIIINAVMSTLSIKLFYIFMVL